MQSSTKDSINPCTIRENFDLHTITSVAGANLPIDFMNGLGINHSVEKLSMKRASWADYSAELELQSRIVAYALGY